MKYLPLLAESYQAAGVPPNPTFENAPPAGTNKAVWRKGNLAAAWDYRQIHFCQKALTAEFIFVNWDWVG